MHMLMYTSIPLYISVIQLYVAITCTVANMYMFVNIAQEMTNIVRE